MEHQINDELCKISSWLEVNKLSLDIKKTHYIVFSRKRKSVPTVSIKIDGDSVSQISKTKFLGVFIDSKLNWKSHILHTAKKLSRSIAMLVKAKCLLSRKSLVRLYYLFIFPYSTYCNHIWGSTYKSNLGKITTLQNSVIRIIFNANRYTSIEPLYRLLGIIQFLDNNVYLISPFMFRCILRQVPRCLNSFFATNHDIHFHNTRQSNHLHIPCVKSDLGKFSMRYRGAVIWNTTLQLKISPDTSDAVFSKTIKTCIRNGLLKREHFR